MSEIKNISVGLEPSPAFAQDLTILSIRIPVPNDLLLREESHPDVIEAVITALKLTLAEVIDL